MASTVGERIIKKLYEYGPNPMIGSEKEAEGTFDPAIVDPNARKQAEEVWTLTAEEIMAGAGAEYRRLPVYDGSAKKSDPTKNLPDAFIPESELRPAQDYEDYQNDVTDNTIVEVNTAGTGSPPTWDNSRLGYRIIISDDKVKTNSVILYTLRAIPLNQSYDVPENFVFNNPSETYIAFQKDGEWHLHIEEKSCYLLEYSVWNNQVNIDTKPTFVEYES